MIRLLLILLLALLIGAGLAVGLQYDLGYIRISLGNYLVETNFWVGLALFILLVMLSVFLVGAGRRLFHGGGMVSGWVARGNQRRARRRTTQGLLAMAEGNWPRARKLLTSSA
ncbi:MAG: heme biosynthesis HemY N-terminal domain-containing protein, partial [Pseudomonadota bacterium]|nr:heme biosynthesis HemY N-terminal domain-containing protein [Pseudomonadota bacterium]